jgi:hypothetical protein
MNGSTAWKKIQGLPSKHFSLLSSDRAIKEATNEKRDRPFLIPKLFGRLISIRSLHTCPGTA